MGLGSEEYYKSVTIDEIAKEEPAFGVIVVDMQTKILQHYEDKANLIATQIKVLEHCRMNDVPVAMLEFKGDFDNYGSTVPELENAFRSLNRRKRAKIVRPDTAYCDQNGFLYCRDFPDETPPDDRSDLAEFLQYHDVRHVFLMGVNASGCVADTASGARYHNFRTVTSRDVIADTPMVKEPINISESYGSQGLIVDNVEQILPLIKAPAGRSWQH